MELFRKFSRHVVVLLRRRYVFLCICFLKNCKRVRFLRQVFERYIIFFACATATQANHFAGNANERCMENQTTRADIYPKFSSIFYVTLVLFFCFVLFKLRETRQITVNHYKQLNESLFVHWMHICRSVYSRLLLRRRCACRDTFRGDFDAPRGTGRMASAWDSRVGYTMDLNRAVTKYCVVVVVVVASEPVCYLCEPVN